MGMRECETTDVFRKRTPAINRVVSTRGMRGKRNGKEDPVLFARYFAVPRVQTLPAIADGQIKILQPIF